MIELKDGTHIGDLCFKGLSADGVSEIGYGILPQYQGKGYATEAVTAALKWAFEHPEVTAIEAEAASDNMRDNNRIKLALKRYPFYEATSGDLLFFSVIQTLFLIQVKGFSAADIATIILITDIADLILKYPTYKIIRRLGNSHACVIGGIMPLIGILLITIGWTLPLVAVGNIFFVSAGNFQSMASAGARNNHVLLGEKEKYAKLFSKGNTIYSLASMISAILIPILFSVNKYLPSVLCIVTCAVIAGIFLFIPDYTDRGGILRKAKEERQSSAKTGKGLRLLLVVFCLFFCADAVFTSNTEVFLSSRLEDIFTEQKTIFIYGAIIWAARMLRLVSNILLPKILDKLKENIVVIATVMLLTAFLAIGVSGVLLRKTTLPIIAAGVAYIVVKGILWDPLRTFLRMTAVDTNSKKRQQRMLVLLNAGQSVISIIMDLIIVGILKVLSLEYVFLAFAIISFATVICAAMLRKEYKRRVDGMKNKKISVILVSELADFNVYLRLDNEERSIFTLPKNGNNISLQIFQGFLQNI